MIVKETAAISPTRDPREASGGVSSRGSIGLDRGSIMNPAIEPTTVPSSGEIPADEAEAERATRLESMRGR